MAFGSFWNPNGRWRTICHALGVAGGRIMSLMWIETNVGTKRRHWYTTHANTHTMTHTFWSCSLFAVRRPTSQGRQQAARIWRCAVNNICNKTEQSTNENRHCGHFTFSNCIHHIVAFVGGSWLKLVSSSSLLLLLLTRLFECWWRCAARQRTLLTSSTAYYSSLACLSSTSSCWWLGLPVVCSVAIISARHQIIRARMHSTPKTHIHNTCTKLCMISQIEYAPGEFPKWHWHYTSWTLSVAAASNEISLSLPRHAISHFIEL